MSSELPRRSNPFRTPPFNVSEDDWPKYQKQWLSVGNDLVSLNIVLDCGFVSQVTFPQVITLESMEQITTAIADWKGLLSTEP